MDKDIANLKPHDVRELVPRVRGLRTLNLAGPAPEDQKRSL